MLLPTLLVVHALCPCTHATVRSMTAPKMTATGHACCPLAHPERPACGHCRRMPPGEPQVAASTTPSRVASAVPFLAAVAPAPRRRPATVRADVLRDMHAPPAVLGRICVLRL